MVQHGNMTSPLSRSGHWVGSVLTAGSGPGEAIKGRQSCPTLCDPTDGSPPGSAVPGILQARTLGLPLGLALGSPIFPSGCGGKLGVALEPGESQGRGSLVGCHLWGRIESDMTEAQLRSRLPFGPRSQASLQKAQGPGLCKLPKPPASRALCQAKRAPMDSSFHSNKRSSSSLPDPLLAGLPENTFLGSKRDQD